MNNFMLISLTTQMKGTNSLKVQMTKAHQKDTDNLNSPLFTKEIGFIDETYPQKTPSSDGFTGDSIPSAKPSGVWLAQVHPRQLAAP